MGALTAKTHFNVALPRRCQAKLDALVAATRRSRPNVIEILIERATVRDLMVIPETQEEPARPADQSQPYGTA
jgi:hypothetical protein